MKHAVITMIMLAMLASTSYAAINMDAILSIESGGDSNAYNRNSGAIGLYQITNICRIDYNQCNKTMITREQLYNASINKRVADWYINIRIPQLLKAKDYEVNDRNILIAYNAGIKYVGKQLPRETVNYIAKYNRIK